MDFSSNSLAQVVIHRFHTRKYLPKQLTSLLTFFLDGEHLAKQQGRFAGTYLNPGYFFSLTPEACIFEMLYYNRVRNQSSPESLQVTDVLESSVKEGNERVFLSCEGSFEKILNLLWPNTLWSTLQKCFPSMHRPTVGFDSGSVILALARTPMGGDMLTDVIGKYAYKNEFNGIRFPSARALDIRTSRPWSGGTLRDGLRFGARGDESFEFDDMMNEIHKRATNVVLFRGTFILHCVKRFRVQTVQGCTEWCDNEFYDVLESEIEREVIGRGGWCAEDMFNECSDFIADPKISFDWKR